MSQGKQLMLLIWKHAPRQENSCRLKRSWAWEHLLPSDRKPKTKRTRKQGTDERDSASAAKYTTMSLSAAAYWCLELLGSISPAASGPSRMKRASDRWNLLTKRSREMMSVLTSRLGVLDKNVRHWFVTHADTVFGPGPTLGLAAILSWPGNEETRKYFLIFTPIWGRFPIWLIFSKWVETTN